MVVYTEFANTDKYGEPKLSDMLNWIVAEVSNN